MNIYIEQKYIELGGGTGFLGGAIDVDININYGAAFKRYANGVIFYSPDYGAVLLYNSVFDKWYNLPSDIYGPVGGQPMQDYIGFPIQDGIVFGHAEYSYFEKGIIVHNNYNNKIYLLYGEIYAKYKLLNDVQGWLGLPINDELPEPHEGRSVHFEHGAIYWTIRTAAFEVHGAILSCYSGTRDVLGYPVSDEQPILNGSTEIGRQSRFENGIIFWSSSSGAHELHGELLAAYLTQFGGPIGLPSRATLGFPISNQKSSPSGRKIFNNFQRGILVINLDDPIPRSGQMITRLDFYVESFTSRGNDTILAAQPDLFVKVKLISNLEGDVFTTQIGEEATSSPPTYQIEAVLKSVPITDGNLALTVSLEGWDYDATSHNDLLGSFARTHTIDTLWELPELDWNHSNFLANYQIRRNSIDFIPITNFRQQLFWKFSNDGSVDVPELSKDQYAQTFADVDEDEHWWRWANNLFYILAYKDCASHGNCFGMCLEALYALQGKSLSTELISQYNLDNTRKNEINIKQAYQLGVSEINFYIQSFFEGKMFDPLRAFNESQRAFINGDAGVLNIVHFNVTTFAPGVTIPSIDAGHAVIPYDWDTRDPNRFVIKIANPNQPFGTGTDSDPGNIIEILNPNSSPSYNFQMGLNADGTPNIWNGNNTIFSHTWLFFAPFSRYATQPATPVWEALALVWGIIVFIVADNGQAEQVTDENEKTFYRYEESPKMPGIKTKKLNLDPVNRIPNMVIAPQFNSPDGFIGTFPPLNIMLQFQTRPPEIYYLKKQINRSNIFPKSTTKNGIKTSNPFTLSPSHIAVAALSNNFAKHLNPNNVATHFDPELAGKLTTLFGILKKSNLKFEIKEKNLGGNYKWFYSTPFMSIVVDSPAIMNANDFISIEGVASPGQAISIITNENCNNKKINVSIMGFQNKAKTDAITFEIENITMFSKHSLSFQLNNGGKELILHNTGPEIMFDLKLLPVNKKIVQPQKTNIKLGANNLSVIQPINLRVSKSPINYFIMDKINGNVINHLVL